MPHEKNGIKYFSLLEALHSIQATLLNRYTSSFWVKAEMLKLNHYEHSGHCYPDLVEKTNNRIVAQTRAIIWKDDFIRINRRFIETIKEPVKDGISVLIYCRINFDPLYGLSLRIIDMDPSLYLGELEKEKMETIAKIKKEGLWNKNKELPFALLPKRLAIISVKSSKGYSDFLNIIYKEKENFSIFTYIFPSLLQGDHAVESILMALNNIEIVKHHFDCVLLIRGGGGDIGLSCYNNYELVKRIATFPIPVLTGIGHSTNETVCEMVSFQSTITPTNLADFIISKFKNFNNNLNNIRQNIVLIAKDRMEREKQRLSQYEKTLELLNPKNLLKRGYTITLMNNEIIKSLSKLKEGDSITTLMEDGEIESTIKKIKR
ncbi:MAG: exodeoxyribonuclease VII large subunit [Bacteroidales bacterium]|nr:exodeoxyribonuclease VII large subunit [Bacteroidales bacterium]